MKELIRKSTFLQDKMLVRSRAPLRLGLAGGGTDVSPYCDIYGSYVLNATIDRYAYALIQPRDDNKIKFCALDKKESIVLEAHSHYDIDKNLALHKAVYNHIIKNYNQGRAIPLELSSFCDAPIGSGLGSSSAIVVAMIKAFIEFLNLPLDDYQIAQTAYHIERIDCKFQGGKQDQYAATFGGFNFMEFYQGNRAIINSLRIKNWILSELEASLLLFYTGQSRESAKIIEDQSKNIQTGSDYALEAMHAIKKEASEMKEGLLKGNFSMIVESMKRGWESKKASAKSVSNSHINEIYETAISKGALAGKVSGAGGGGFMMFFVPPEKRMDVTYCLSEFDGQLSNCHFTRKACQAWSIR